MSTKHTPGPWVIADRWPEIHATDARSTLVANITGAQSNPTAMADASMIAAAPDLLSVLIAARDYLSCIPESAAGGDDDAARLCRDANAAIAKAIGEQS